jgi:hypothetical protein
VFWLDILKWNYSMVKYVYEILYEKTNNVLINLVFSNINIFVF